MNPLSDLDISQLLPLLIGISSAALVLVAAMVISSIRQRRIVRLPGVESSDAEADLKRSDGGWVFYSGAV